MGVVSSTVVGVIGTAILLGGAGYYGSTLLGKGKKKESKLTPAALPAAPLGAEATPEQKERIRRKTKTILTAPLTGEEDFGVAPPTLLGSGDVKKKKTVG